MFTKLLPLLLLLDRICWKHKVCIWRQKQKPQACINLLLLHFLLAVNDVDATVLSKTLDRLVRRIIRPLIQVFGPAIDFVLELHLLLTVNVCLCVSMCTLHAGPPLQVIVQSLWSPSTYWDSMAHTLRCMQTARSSGAANLVTLFSDTSSDIFF